MSKPIALFKKIEKIIFDSKWFFCQKKVLVKKKFVKKIVVKKEFSIKKNFG